MTRPNERFTDMYSSNKARPGSYAVYISGVRIPCQHATVTTNVWGFPTATIDVPPDENLLALGKDDRAHLAIFYLDTYYGADTAGGLPTPTFRILFEGEIMSWAYSRQPNMRTVRFQAISWQFIMTQLFIEHTTSIFTEMIKNANSESGTKLTIFSDKSTYPYNIFKSGFTGDHKAALHIPIDFVKQVIRLIEKPDGFAINQSSGRTIIPGNPAQLQEKLPNNSPSIVGLMSFYLEYSKAYLGALESRVANIPGVDDTKFPFLKNLQNTELLKRLTNQVSESAGMYLESRSLWDLLVLTIRQMYHEIFMFSTPTTAMVDTYTKPQTNNTAIPRCNVLFPSGITSLSYREDFWSQPTRVFSKHLPSLVTALTAGTNIAMKETIEYSNLRGWPEEIKGKIDSYRAGDSALGQASLSEILTAEEAGRGPIEKSLSPSQLIIDVQENLNAAGDTGDFDFIQEWVTYEYKRMKATARSGSVSLAFNPYIVHSFPCAIFDNHKDKLHIQAFVNSVTHTLSSSGMRTDLTISDIKPFETGVSDKTPFIPDEDARLNMLSSTDKADGTLGNLFTGYSLGKNQFSPSLIDVSGISGRPGDVEAATGPGSALPQFNNIYGDNDIIGTGSASALPGLTDLGTLCFLSHDFAMEQYSARKIVSLNEYLAFYEGSRGEYIFKANQMDHNTGIARAPDVFVTIDDQFTPENERAIALANTGEQVIDANPFIATIGGYLPWENRPNSRQDTHPVPWRRNGSQYGLWAQKVFVVLKKALDHGHFFDDKIS